MEDKIAKIELRDDGFLEIILAQQCDYDDYLYQQIQSDGNCLPCVRDYRESGKLYYDTKGYVTLKDYLQDHIFIKGELASFFVYIFEAMIQVNASKPIYMDLSHIYLHHDGIHIRFLVVPIGIENWYLPKQTIHTLLREVLVLIRTDDDYDVVGYIQQIVKRENLSITQVAQGIHDFIQPKKRKLHFIERLFHLEKEENYQIRDLPQPTPYPQYDARLHMQEQSANYNTMSEDVVNVETMVLFEEHGCYFENVETNKREYIHKECFTIGRNPDNELYIKEFSISSYHACFHSKSSILEDLHSSNGTFVNKRRIQRVELRDGDQVQFANHEFIYHIEDTL